ncbi:hypothetical protein JCM8208_004191 [Rhodotorula glutinis]
MKVCALLSGGKDSVYTLHAAVVEGHLPVALASLVPPEGKDELDSFMYQTVGSSGLATLADALALPLVTHTITGTARNQRAEYGSRNGAAATATDTADDQGDETEDLYDLLVKVKLAHPDVEAITVGAILSNYQRVRVEHVCARLGLVPLAYLWERDQVDLLADMVDAGIESILVKVAGAGLGVQHLGKTLAQMQPTLLKLNKMYDTHPCGEGGEYETFTLDAPLFLRRVQLDATTLVTSVPDPNATVAHWHLDALSLSPLKPAYAGAEHGVARWERARELCRASVRVPRVEAGETREWERRGRRAYARAGKGRERERVRAGEVEGEGGAELQDAGRRRAAAGPSAGAGPSASEGERTAGASSACTTRDGWLYVSEVVAPASRRGAAVVIEDEVRGCFEALVNQLAEHGATLLSLAHLTVYLSTPASPSSPSTMSLFPRINAVYASYFGTSPPTRACVEVPSSDEGEGSWRVKLEGVARVPGAGARSSEERKALHVQGLSYWAPANIGPYSQSVLTANRLYTAGQIPLRPSTLTLPPPPSSSSPSSSDHGFSHAAALAMQHVHRIADASLPGPAGARTRRKEGGVLWLAPVEGDDEWRRRAEAGAAVWRAAAASPLEDEEDEAHEGEDEADPEHGSDDEADEDLDDEAVPPLVLVEAAALPRGAPVEWQVTYCGGGARAVDWEGAESSDEEGEGEKGRAQRAAEQRMRDEDARCVRMETVSNTTARPVVYHRSPATPSLSSTLSAHDARGSALAILACSLDEHDQHPLPGLARHDVAQVRAFYRHDLGSASRVRALAQRVLGVKLGAEPDEPSPALSLVPAGRLAVLAQAGAVEDAEVVFVLVGPVE